MDVFQNGEPNYAAGMLLKMSDKSEHNPMFDLQTHEPEI